jgi:hypothetical protein
VVGIYIEKISLVASQSACAKYSWKDRGRAPAGYNKGMALSFARSLCREKGLLSLSSPAAVMAKAKTSDATKDALAHYETTFDALKMEIDHAGEETMQSLYALGVGLGMRESSGKYCEGWDTTASDQTASTAETGLFQVSYNSISATSELTKLYNEYKADESRCYLATYSEGAVCKTQSYVGTGAGLDFQKFTRRCPAFAAEYAMTLARVLRKHWGPLNRKEAEVTANCNSMLEDVRRLVDEDPANACRDVR